MTRLDVRLRMKFVVVGFWIFVIAAIFAAAASVPTWLLWNWLVPDLFGLPHVSLLQAFGLLLLSGFLFGPRKISVEASS